MYTKKASVFNLSIVEAYFTSYVTNFFLERASSRYTGGSNKYSKMVFKQAIFFVGAFYITWLVLSMAYEWVLLHFLTKHT